MKMHTIYHKHTSLSNVFVKDSVLQPIDYWNEFKKRYGDRKVAYCTTEHYWQGNYFQIYDDLEKYNKKNETNIKFVFGVEAGFVKDRYSKDRAGHIILLAKNDNGRKKINKALSIANKTGFHYNPRLDMELMLSLPKEDVMVTTACIALWNRYDWNEVDEMILTLNNHFDSFYLEIQPHNTEPQIKLNKHLLELSKKYNIPLIAGTDTHAITKQQVEDRDYYLKSNKLFYEDEEGWYLDFPSYELLVNRFKEQNIFKESEIIEAIENTNIILDFEDIVLDRSLKVPTLYPDKTLEEREEILRKILRMEWRKQLDTINKDKYDEYMKEIINDIEQICGCNMQDYFLFNYEVIKLAKEKYGGVLTQSGRGSNVGMFTNKLLGFTNIDKVNSPIDMYSERFLTKERVLESHTPPDEDFNVSDRKPFELAQKELIGEYGVYDMLALGKLKYKSAFKMYCRANDVEPKIANEVSKQIDKYEKAFLYKEEDEKIDIFDFVDKEKYGHLIDGCQNYLGIVESRKGHPCAFLILDKDIEEEVGIMLCKSESTGKEIFVALIESGTIDYFGFLKNDFLIVDSVTLIDRMYKEANMEYMDTNTLLEVIKDNDKIWEVYSSGDTIGINQCEKPKTALKCMNFKPSNIVELTQFIAGIRPSFKSLYSKFEAREHFEYGIEALDRLLQSEYCNSSWILFQEQLMKVLAFAGFPMGETYSIIKAISKKKENVVATAKKKFIENFSKETGSIESAEKVWGVIDDFSKYGFNCVSGDTKFYRQSNQSGYNPTIEEMFKIKNDKDYAKSINKLSLHSKYKREGYGKALSLNDDGKFRQNNIVDIRYAGFRDVYELSTNTGKTIICTDNHKFPTTKGEKRLDELKVGDVLYSLGNYEKTKFDSSLSTGIKNLPKRGQQGFQKNPNGGSVLFEKEREKCIKQKESCKKCGENYEEFKKFELHHIDLNRKNNKKDNLMWLCNSCHKKEHYKIGRNKRYKKGIPHLLEEVVSIKYVDKRNVYDVEMETPNHNFVIENGLLTSNSAHAYSMAIDSVSLAYFKAYHPLVFYKVMLERFGEKMDKNKITLIKKEMSKRGVTLKPCKFGDDNRKFSIDYENNCIIQTMSSIKGMSKITPNVLYELGKEDINDIVDLFIKLDETKLKKNDTLYMIKLNYYEKFGNANYLIEVWNKFNERYKKTHSEKTKTSRIEEIREFAKNLSCDTSDMDLIRYEVELLGYTDTIREDFDDCIYVVEEVIVNQYGTPFMILYQLKTGERQQVKCNKSHYSKNKIEGGKIIKTIIKDKLKKVKDENGRWVDSNEYEKIIDFYFEL